MNTLNLGTYKKMIKRDETYYNLEWSPYIVCEKFTMLKKLTEMTGIYVVFMLNKYKRLEPIFVGTAWYSGLRPMVLKLFNPSSMDNIPRKVEEIVKNEKVFLKFLEVYDLPDIVNITYKLKEWYKEAFFDGNGLQKPEGLQDIKLIDTDTKTYHKKKKED
jgi:hypothetical protein